MVKQEVIQWRFVWKTQRPLLLIPIMLWLVVILAGSSSQQLAKDLAVFLLYPSLAFPVVGLMSSIGSAYQKELWITLPVSPWRAGAVRPLLMSLLYAGLFTSVLHRYYTPAQVAGGCISVLMYMLLIALITTLFKNSAFGLCGGLIFLFFGLFTGGSGQGPLYLMQWYRQVTGLPSDVYLLEQGVFCLVALFGTVQLIRFRERFHLLKD
ncbi:hypothetical protein JJQ72_10515 [Paenibacillus sp. F411]|uniref:ABC-2 family transporter protein n=1 Tax=Paenibacillus algicola TaxID=2565926 RepID=A0A4P8XFD3_9BACL|nr:MULTISPECIES: hypothetical protein [Paenibacillus]MBO2944401.1 hypothetical protein [Paenibacillus sp. F411]QCT01065.1 hypothetical protein E6C60_0341 [Paenibacillus algicola]